MGDFLQNTEKGINFLTIPSFSHTGLVTHGFSTRTGGVSQDNYSSLNLGTHVGDDLAAVVENRRRICKLLAMEPDRLVAAKQVHGHRIHQVSSSDIGLGALDYQSALDNIDALITDVPGVPISTYYADCVPLLFLDPVKKVIALAHAGWKGTVSLIGRKTVLEMVKTYGCDPRQILIGIGPSIGPNCYQVGEGVAIKVQEVFPYWQELLKPSGDEAWKLNLWEANRKQLVEMGIKRENISMANLCTCCHNKIFYSYRADGGITGRLGAMLMLKTEGGGKYGQNIGCR